MTNGLDRVRELSNQLEKELRDARTNLVNAYKGDSRLEQLGYQTLFREFMDAVMLDHVPNVQTRNFSDRDVQLYYLGMEIREALHSITFTINDNGHDVIELDLFFNTFICGSMKFKLNFFEPHVKGVGIGHYYVKTNYIGEGNSFAEFMAAMKHNAINNRIEEYIAQGMENPEDD